MLNNGTWKLIM